MGRQLTADYFEHPDVRGVSVSLEAVFFPMARPLLGAILTNAAWENTNFRSISKRRRAPRLSAAVFGDPNHPETSRL